MYACENQVIKQSSPASPRGRFHRTGGTPHCCAVILSLCTRLALVSVMNILSGKKVVKQQSGSVSHNAGEKE